MVNMEPISIHVDDNEYWYNNKFRFDNVMWLSPLATENFDITQLGEVYCEKDIGPPEHYQHFYELTFIVTGHGYCYTDGICCELNPGMIYLSCPGENHKIVSDRENSLRFMFVAFSTRSAKANELMEAILSHHREKDRRAWKSAECFSVMQSMLDIFRRKNTLYELLMDLELQKMLVFSIRSSDTTEQPPVKLQRNNILFNLVSYIDINFLKITSIKSLSSHFGYDYQYISKIFKKAFGICIQEYIVNKKMEYAKELLTKGNKSVVEASNILNYSAPNNFSRAFKIKYGISPQAFKNQEKSTSF